MDGKNLAKLVHRLAKNPKDQQKFLNGEFSSDVTCNSLEHAALKKVFSHSGQINIGFVASFIPLGFWA
jgi:hypothetical protein